MNTMKTYLLTVVAASFLYSLIANFLTNGKCKKILSFIGTLLMTVTVLSPLAKLDATKMSKAIAELQLETEEWKTGVDIQNRELIGVLIKQKSEAYVLDKAEAMEVALSLEITLQDDGGYPYPYRISIDGTWTEEEKHKLSIMISEDLGIPAERQEWNGT